MMTSNRTFLLADDHEMVRAGFRKLLEMNFPDSRILEAGNHAEAIKLCSSGIKIDLYLLDINMGKGSISDTITQIRQYDPEARILVVSMFGEEQYAVRMIQAGANGFISKSASPKEYQTAIKKILDGKKYISGNMAEILADFASNPSRHNHPVEALSNREYEVLCQIANGKTVSEIASSLNLSVKTISTHRAKILEKTGLKNNAEIMFFALKNKLLPGIG